MSKTLGDRSKTYARRLVGEINESNCQLYYKIQSAYEAGYRRGEIVAKKQAWDDAAVFYDKWPEKLQERVRQIFKLRHALNR